MTRPLATLLRPVVAALCSLTLALPASARAAEPAPEPTEGPLTDSLSPKAAEHVAKAYEEHKSGAFLNAESAFKRAAFFEPRWRPLHFNLGIVAEAQGHLGTAIREYRTFRPHATADEALIVDQRIVELDARRRRIVSQYRGQIAASAIVLGIGLGMMAGGGVLAGINAKSISDPEEETKRKRLLTVGVTLAIYGLIVFGVGFIPLAKAVRSKRQLEGLALGPTRLRLTGSGATLRF